MGPMKKAVRVVVHAREIESLTSVKQDGGGGGDADDWIHVSAP